MSIFVRTVNSVYHIRGGSESVLFYTMQLCSLFDNMGIMTRFKAQAGLIFLKLYHKCIENDKATLMVQVISSSVVHFILC